MWPAATMARAKIEPGREGVSCSLAQPLPLSRAAKYTLFSPERLSNQTTAGPPSAPDMTGLAQAASALFTRDGPRSRPEGARRAAYTEAARFM